MLFLISAKLFCTLKVAYAGGDKAAEDCKDVKGREMTSFHAALKDLVFAVSIVSLSGQGPKAVFGRGSSLISFSK